MENMTPNEELKILCHSSKERLMRLREEYYEACKEEYKRIEKFFNEHKDDMCIEFGEILSPATTSMSNVPEGIKDRLTRNLKLAGLRDNNFGIFVPGNGRKPLTDELIDKLRFLDKASIDLINEINPIGTETSNYYSTNVPVCYSKLLTDGKYGVIIYAVGRKDEHPVQYLYNKPVKNITDFGKEDLRNFLKKEDLKLKIFIGKYKNEANNIFGTYEISFKFIGKSYFRVTPCGILDSVIFQDPNEFSSYISKYGFRNDMDTDLIRLPEVVKHYGQQ